MKQIYFLFLVIDIESIYLFNVKKVDFRKHQLQQNIILLFLSKKVKYLNDERVDFNLLMYSNNNAIYYYLLFFASKNYCFMQRIKKAFF